MSGLHSFVTESNRIEGILRGPTQVEIEAHVRFFALQEITVPDVVEFVRIIALADLRDKPGMDVRVGNHFPPPGGSQVRINLERICGVANLGNQSPYELHLSYEKLHPFMDGNGRSGRAIWAWQMKRDGNDPFSLPFLHRFYYQTLNATP